MNVNPRWTRYQIGDILGLRSEGPGSGTVYKAIDILAARWDPEKSTAQPPLHCAHATLQNTRHGPACATCGASPSVHAEHFGRERIR